MLGCVVLCCVMLYYVKYKGYLQRYQAKKRQFGSQKEAI